MPVEMEAAITTVINGRVYVGGGSVDGDDCYLVSMYDPVKNEWGALPPATVGLFGVGRMNGKLVIVGGGYDERGVTGDVHTFEEDTQQWVKSIPPMPTGLIFSVVTNHNSSVVVCGMPDESSPAAMFVYNSQSSQWYSKTPPPLSFNSLFSSAVVVNGTYYIAVGCEGVVDSESHPFSPVVFSLPLSTLVDPNASQDPSTWQRIPDTPCHMSRLAATGGCLLALGGLHNACDLQSGAVASNITTAVHAFCPAASSWVKIGDLPDLRLRSAITTLSSGELFIAGGLIDNDELDYDIKAFIGIIR